MNTDKARESVQFCGVTERNNGKPIKIITPASPIWQDGKRSAPRCACVTVLRRLGHTLELTCNTSPIGDGDEEKCIGMAKGALCYHSLAAVLVCAGETGHALHFFRSEDDARRALESKPGSVLLQLKAGYGGGQGFAVAFPPRQKKTAPQSDPDELKPLAISRP